MSNKIAILGDLHLGMRIGSNHFSQHANKFFSEVFYPYLVEHEIKEVIQLGDVFDSRTSLSVKAYKACKSTWFDPLVEHDIHLTALLGNHDIFHKSSLQVNTPELFLGGEYENNITVVSSPIVINKYGTTFAMVPWICDENREDVFNFMSRDHVADVCCGHFEIVGFDMSRGIPGNGGLPRDLFDKFEQTWSGHYHTKSYDEYHRIQYVGTPYEITFADMHDPKGFHVFDTETRQLEFIYNPNTMFDRIIYNEGWHGDVATMSGKSVKLVVEKKTDLYAFDRFVDSVKLANVYDLKIIENFGELANVDVDGNIHVEDSVSIINAYVDNLTTSVDKTRLKDYLAGLYNEAVALQ